MAGLDWTVFEPKQLLFVLGVVGVGEAAQVLSSGVGEEEGGVFAIGSVVGLHPSA